MCNGVYTDVALLDKGIYTTQKPTIYSKDETIEYLILRGRTMKDIVGNCFISEEYFENLSKCELVDITISIKK